jgi:hypothetical protein
VAKLFKQQGNASAIPANIIPQEMGTDDFILLAKGAPDILLPRYIVFSWLSLVSFH